MHLDGGKCLHHFKFLKCVQISNSLITMLPYISDQRKKMETDLSTNVI